MTNKPKNKTVYRASLKRITFIYLACILLAAFALQIEYDLEMFLYIPLLGITYLLAFISDYFGKVTINAEGIEYRRFWKSKFISWNDINYIKTNLWYDFQSHPQKSMLIYKKNDSDKPYLSIGSNLIEIPTLEIQEDEKPDSYLRRLMRVKRRKLMVDSVEFEHTQFYQNVRNFAPHLQIEEDVAYT